MRRVSEADELGGGACVGLADYDTPERVNALRGDPWGCASASPAGDEPLSPVEGYLLSGPASPDRCGERAQWVRDHVVPHEPWLRRWLQRHGVEQDIEDVVQESYALLIQAARVDHVRNPRNYFCQTARSVILRRARRDAIVRIECVDALEMRDLPAEQPLHDRVIAGRQDLRLLLDTLEQLPARTRDVFTLRRIEGLSLIDTARRLDISQSAVEKHLRAALRSLALTLGRATA